jgi:hypothetical protein
MKKDNRMNFGNHSWTAETWRSLGKPHSGADAKAAKKSATLHVRGS